MFVAPSILSIKKEERVRIINELYQYQIKYLHIDIMDGIFVENKTDGVEIMNDIPKRSSLLDVHLMVKNPLSYITPFINAGAGLITFHYEAVDNPSSVIDEIKRNSCLAGISIKPDTPVDVLLPILDKIDLVLVMSVEPGKGGQKFINNSLNKINDLNKLKEANKFNFLIEVDGGINEENAPLLKQAGADIVVVGTYLMNNQNKEQVIKRIEGL